MRTWVVTAASVMCGLCPTLIPAQTWAQQITIPNVKRPHWRCVACAEGSPPEQLPSVPATRTRSSVAPAMSSVREIARDLKPEIDRKQAAAGDDAA